jgi:thiol-disulfide isomerase/thioredoxin
MKKSVLCCLIAVITSACGSRALAAPSAQEAIADYNQGKYLSCLQKLQALNLKNNPTAHYYIALCAQNLNRITEAKAEYTWVVTYSGEPLRGYAQKGLANLDKLRSSAPSPSAAMPIATTAASQPVRPVAAAATTAKVQKIIDFSTTWCGPCQAFAPHFEEAQKHFRNIQFVSLDGDNPDNASLKEKYKVHAYPTLVFLDSSGKVLSAEAGAPNSLADFEQTIKGFGGEAR